MSQLSPSDSGQDYVAALRAFQVMRGRGVTALGEFFSRLERELLEATAPASVTSVPPSRGALGSTLRQWFRHWPHYRRQAAMLAARPATGNDCILATSGARLFCEQLAPDPRAHLRQLVRPLPGQPENPLLDHTLATADWILLFDPSAQSRYWEKQSALHGARIAIIDVGYLFWLTRRAWLGSAWRAVRPGAPLREFGLKSAFVATVLDAGYRRFTATRRSVAFFLTSNSFATETLRFHLLRAPRCASIQELMHGIPSREFTDYFHTLLPRLEPANAPKHCFVPLLPDLPTEGLPLAGGSASATGAVNAYINRYFINHPLPPADAGIRLANELGRLLPATTGVRPLLLVFVGGNSHDADFLRSRALQAECTLIQILLDAFAARRQTVAVVYCPHPRHAPAIFEQHDFFRQHAVSIYRETVYAWLVADACLSLVSSSLFESAYLGVPTFTPLLASDDIFGPELLDQLTHPRAPGRASLRQALEDFTDEALPRARDEPINRALSRLDRLRAG